MVVGALKASHLARGQGVALAHIRPAHAPFAAPAHRRSSRSLALHASNTTEDVPPPAGEVEPSVPSTSADPVTAASAAGGEASSSSSDGSAGASASSSTTTATASTTPRRRRRKKKDANAGAAGDDKPFSVDDINPYQLGRRSRALFDDVWSQFTKLSSPVRSIGLDDDSEFMVGDLSGSIFETPQASYTTVLVAGATGRVGRVLIRKLLLRGYKVRALVRDRDGAAAEQLPRAVELVKGDVGDYASCRRAVEGCEKVRAGWGGMHWQ